jgi:hypothetical protein
LKFRINEKIKRCSLGRHCEIIGAFNSSWRTIVLHNNL